MADKDNVAEWVEKLKAGKYTQTPFTDTPQNSSHCIMGAALKAYGYTDIEKPSRAKRISRWIKNLRNLRITTDPKCNCEDSRYV